MRRVRATVVTVAGVLALALGAAPAQAISGSTALPDPAAAPWMASVAFRGDEPLSQRAYCGGTLIAADRVPTAAHCVEGKSASGFEVHLGAAVYTSAGGPALGVRGISTHPGFKLIPSPKEPDDLDAAGAASDAAVLVLDRPGLGVQLVLLATQRPAVGAPMVAFGHGLTQPQVLGDVLQRGSFAVLAGDKCSPRLGGVVDQTSIMCAEGTTPGTTCPPATPAARS